jgi:hypothetical protein
MASYRIYFIDRLRKVRWPHDLDAADDNEAIALAQALQFACADLQADIELWQEGRFVLAASCTKPADLRAVWDAVSTHHQEALVESEEALLNSRSAVARSRTLLQTLEGARNQNEFADVEREVRSA